MALSRMPLVVRVSTVAMMRSISAVVRTSGRCLPNFGVSTNSAGDASIWSLMSRKLKKLRMPHRQRACEVFSRPRSKSQPM